MLKVGVTGGIGSGKSLVCKVFSLLGVPVYNADRRALHLAESHPAIVEGYTKLLGDKAYFKDGRLNRPFVASKIFSNPVLLKGINQLVHPFIQKDFIDWSRNFDVPFVIEEAAILLESGANQHLDRVILVSAPEELRVQRVMYRDGVQADKVMQRMARQWTDAQRKPHCEYCILNDNQQLLLPQIFSIYNAIIEIDGGFESL